MKKVEVSKENYEKYVVIIDEINHLLNNIKADTGGLSTHIHILRHPDFEKLKNMGDKIIPYLFYKMLQQSGDWIYFLLLHEITGMTPVPKNELGKFYHTIMHWLKWYLESDYYKNDDIYHGLVAG